MAVLIIGQQRRRLVQCKMNGWACYQRITVGINNDCVYAMGASIDIADAYNRPDADKHLIHINPQ